jgi:hypothetical protein
MSIYIEALIYSLITTFMYLFFKYMTGYEILVLLPLLFMSYILFFLIIRTLLF